LEVRIFGRPAYGEFTDFDAQVSGAPNVIFGGAYAANDLERLYQQVDFSWAIDFMEEGLNSSWLLPNRVYESSRFGVIPIALRGVETGRFLEAHGYGVTLDSVADLECMLDRMTSETYAAHAAQQARVPLSNFVADRSDCRSLVETLSGARERKST
jgi:succinoglycan biosynthesis protein ExoL